MFGFLNLYKPKGMTSHDVVAKLRRVCKIKQIGHTGTLDPFAEGVLPICIGKATRLIEYLSDDKEYLATVQFGQTTDTYDLDGKVLSQSDKNVTKDEIIQALKSFKGEILQMPPIYSAIKVNGKKLYDYAREGKEVEIQPRKVIIKNIELKNFDEGNQSAEILVACSKGTYIRSIAFDLGQALECGGYLTKLIRTRAGQFTLGKSNFLDDFNTAERIAENLINPLDMLDLPRLDVTEAEHRKILMGQHFENKSVTCHDFLILVYNDNVSAVAVVDNGVIKVKKVFI